MAAIGDTRSRRRTGGVAVLALALTLSAPAAAQSGVCSLTADEHDAALSVMRCAGDLLTVRETPDAQYAAEPAGANAAPRRIRLDAGALMIEFHSSARQRNFEILTPIAIAAVRGTKWIVDAEPGQTSTFVVAGVVAVSRRADGRTALLAQGQGVDVLAAGGPLVVKRWKPARVKALLARFGL